MSRTNTVLLVEYDDLDRLLLVRHLRRLGYDVLEATSPEDAEQYLDRAVDAVVTHQHFPKFDHSGKDWARAAAFCHKVRERWPGVPLITLGLAPQTEELWQEKGFPPWGQVVRVDTGITETHKIAQIVQAHLQAQQAAHVH